MIVLVGFPNHGVMWVKVSKKWHNATWILKYQEMVSILFDLLAMTRCRFHLTKFLTAFGKCSPILLQFCWAVYNTEPFKIQTVLEAKRCKDINGYKRNFLIERLRLQNISAVIGSSWYTCTIHQSSQKFVENRHVQNISLPLYVR